MSKRPVRFVLILLGLLVTAGLGYRAQQDELALASARQAAADIDRTAEDALRAVADLRSSVHAYVAPGQGLGFWSARVGALLDSTRQQVLTLDAAAGSMGGSLAESLDGLDRLAAADTRARLYAANGQALLAGDVIFHEIRDLLDASAAQVSGVRQALARNTEHTRASLRQEQVTLAAVVLGAWFVIALLLVPSPEPKAQSPEPRAQSPEPEALSPEPEALSPAPDAHLPDAPELAQVAEICTDLSTLSDLGALTGALARASEVLGATGVIVWVAANDGSHLKPVALHGYDPRLMARIGTIPCDGANLTAAAFRDGAGRTSAATPKSPAALAVALFGPSGPVGVLSAELKAGVEATSTRVAWATIFAAQLATLALPVPPPAAADPAWPQQAQA